MVLHPERRPFYLITSPEEKIRLLAELGIDALILIPFSLDYARTTAEAFVREILWERLRIRKILTGHDYTFGRGKEGNEAFLAEAGRRLGFAVDGDEPLLHRRHRHQQHENPGRAPRREVGFAATLLGRPYNLSGRVVCGNRRGGGLGFPTANIAPDKELVPARGVYAVRCLLEGKRHDGVLNIGFNPTFADGKLSIEVPHLPFSREYLREDSGRSLHRADPRRGPLHEPGTSDRPDRPGHHPRARDPPIPQNYDFVKSRHTRERGYPGPRQHLEKTGFPFPRE